MKRKIQQYKCREESVENEVNMVESENEELKRELDKAVKELMESRDILEQMEKVEIEELE